MKDPTPHLIKAQYICCYMALAIRCLHGISLYLTMAVYEIQGLLATLGAKLGLAGAAAGAGEALCIPPQQVADAALASGHHQRFLRRAIGATVRASSRWPIHADKPAPLGDRTWG